MDSRRSGASGKRVMGLGRFTRKRSPIELYRRSKKWDLGQEAGLTAGRLSLE
jgi:hypothetical protein